MSKTSREEEAQEKRQARIRFALWSSAIVVVIIVFIVLAKLVSSSPPGTTTAGNTPVSSSVLHAVTSLSSATFKSVGQGSVQNLPKPIQAPALTQNSKPEVVYVGAEYCPYCAAERWGMVTALARFGSFSGLQQTHSSSTDSFPNTQTFSFHGATYTSSYLVFNGVETSSNQPQGTAYAPLDTLTAAQQSLLSTYDAAPYVAADSAGAIPFIDFGGKYIISGASYSPSVLQGKTADQIAASLSNTSSDISKGAVGAANTITAAICTLTNNQPASVCSDSMIQGLQSKLNGQ